jgi:hypothetical protein
MKNLWNSGMLTWETISRMTLRQQLILIGFIILPGASLILTFSLFVRRIIRKREKMKTMKTSGSDLEITNEEINNELYNRNE